MDAVTTLPREGLTRADLDAMPDDNCRYELIDGVIIVSAAPAPHHQILVLELAVVLRDACPPGLQVLIAPLDVALAENSVLQPDVLVARRTDLTAKDLRGAPALAVEVLLPSTRGLDLVYKRDRYERAGCSSYWVIDPGADEPPSLVAWELVQGRYVEVARVTGEETWRAERPFEVEVTPSLLLAGR